MSIFPNDMYQYTVAERLQAMYLASIHKFGDNNTVYNIMYNDAVETSVPPYKYIYIGGYRLP